MNKELLKAFLGFDPAEWDTTSTYPPFNYIKVSDTHHRMEFAVAGFKRNELDVSTVNYELIIKGNKENPPKVEYLHKGIGTRAFTRRFILDKNSRVTSAEVVDGILVIDIEVLRETRTNKITIK